MKKIFNIMMAAAISVCTFTACEDVPEPYNNPLNNFTPEENETIEPIGSGTVDDPYNIAGVLDYVMTLGEATSPNEVYFKGVITDIKESFGTQYGNATFTLSDTENATNKFLVYRGLYLGNVKYSDTNAKNIDIGDEIIICGKVLNYGGNTPETASGNAYVYSINGEGGGGDDKPEVKTVGSVDNPQTIEQAIAVINGLADNATTEEYYYVKGKVSKINTTGENVAKYKNINYIISDNGKDMTVYQGRNLDNTDFTKDGELNVGDEVVVFGQLQKYVKDGNVTPELAKGNYIAKLGTGTDTPTPTPTGKGSVTDPYSVAEALTAINALADNGYSDAEVYTKGKVVKVTTNQTNFEKYGNLNYLISDDGSETNTITVYSGDALNGAKFTGIDALKAGDEVVVYGKLQKYVKNDNVTPEIAKGNYLYSLKASGSDTPTPTPTPDGVKTVSVKEFLAAAESTEVWYQLTGTVTNLKDGDLYGNFDLVDGTGSVYVYGVLSEKGGAKKLFQELAADKGIAEGSKLTIIGNRGSYNGKDEVLNAYFVSVENGGTVTPDPTPTPGGSTVTYTMESLGLDNAAELNTQTLSDGTTVTFAAEENQNAPKYYTTGAAARVYAKNSITIKSNSKNITKVVLNCVSTYIGNTQIFGEADGKKVTVAQADPTVTFSGFSSKTLKIVNDYTEAKSGTQLRIVSIEITYAD